MLESLPESIAVIGTGIIGLELGMALDRLGVRVTLFGRSNKIGPFTDPAVQLSVADILGSRLDFRLSTTVDQADVVPGGIRLGWNEVNSNRQTQTFEKVMVAAGRRPNIFDMNLEAAGVQLDNSTVLNWNPQTTQIGDLPLFLAGDGSGHRLLLHEASDEGRIAGSNSMAYPDVLSHVRRTHNFRESYGCRGKTTQYFRYEP